MKEKQKDHVYITEAGDEMPVLPVSLVDLQLAEQGLRDEYKARGEPLDPPRYEIEVFGGGKEWHDHDATTPRTDEEKAAWAAHVDALARFESERGLIIQQMIFEDGIPVTIPADGEWEAKMARRHVALPADPEERRTQYIISRYLKTPADLKGAIARIMVLSAKGHDNQKEIEATMAGFLGDVPTGRNGAGEGAE